MPGKVERENLRLLLFRKSQHGLYAVEFGHVLTLVQENLAVGVVDDRLLDNRRGDDVIDLLRHDHRLAEILADGFVQVPDVFAHIGRSKGFPALFDKDHLAHAFEPAHLGNERLHDDERHDRQ